MSVFSIKRQDTSELHTSFKESLPSIHGPSFKSHLVDIFPVKDFRRVQHAWSMGDEMSANGTIVDRSLQFIVRYSINLLCVEILNSKTWREVLIQLL